MNKFDQVMPMNGLFEAEYRDLTSNAVGETFRIFVAKPGVVEPGKKYPVIYMLDGNAFFATAMEAQRMMAMGGEIPPAFVVGIGYAVDTGFAATMGKRYRDYTPTVGSEVEAALKAQFDPAGELEAGGAPAFLKFLREELKPAIETAYPIDPDDATIAGASLGGLCPAWVLLTQPDTFQRYVLISPSIWWNQEEVWQWEARCSDAQDDLNAHVFVTAGGLETVDLIQVQMQAMKQADTPLKGLLEQSVMAYEKYGWPRMAEITPEFVEKLQSRSYPNLRICCHNMPDETHMSVAAGALSRGLRYVFGHWSP